MYVNTNVASSMIMHSICAHKLAVAQKFIPIQLTH